ncbi:hypothetical protein [Leuconostoc citreum]|uniref:hypothetical protein n=1 Tax=Leuconostoc citreum TaxID=33964 RepID=UPI0015F5F627|nr:hypothetical protein [Leuconostoc citreum]MBA5938542.1 hypothetical protein [Leuconostoc citreum]
MTDWNNKRPEMVKNVSTLGIWKAIYAAPDGNKETARLLVAADGFHFKPTDFDDLVLPSLSFESTKGTRYELSFDDDGKLLINGIEYLTTKLKLSSPNGTVFSVVVDDDGKLTTEKEVSNA